MKKTASGKAWSRQRMVLFITGVVFLFYLGEGSAIGRTIVVPTEYTTIQAAVNAAKTGDIISIQPGTYKESVTILGASKAGISLQGADAATTIINPGGAGRGISIVFADDIWISKLTVTGGYPGPQATYAPEIGGGIFVYESKNVTVSSCLITNNRARDGGGFAAQKSTVILAGNTINANRAVNPNPRSGYSRGGGAFLNLTHGTISNNHFADNMALGPGVYSFGGGLSLDYSDPSVSNNTFSNNRVDWSTFNVGGGLHIYDSLNFTVSGNTFQGNESGGSGGGIAVTESNAAITGNTLIANRAFWGGAGLAFGSNISSSITNNTFIQNTTSHSGGGILRLSGFCRYR